MKTTLFYILAFILVTNSAFSKQLKGIVVDENNQPLQGATVKADDFNVTSTDTKGHFELNNLSEKSYQIQTSFIGYKTNTQPIDSASTIKSITIQLEITSILKEDFNITAIRADKTSPIAYTDISKKELKSNNMGQDIPYLLSMTPSYVATSDGGSGVGYTSFRVRGTDMNRINVTINGIPMNDAESHGTWFVDIPDLAASLDNIQIQRGVGTSTNGAAAFGASINLQTSNVSAKPYTEYHTAGGSFNTFRNSVAAGTGLIDDKYAFDVRLSKVASDGYIDRASSDLKSFFVAGGYYGDKTVIKFNIISGIEETYQAWNGVPSVRLNNDSIGMRTYETNLLYTTKETEEMIASNSRTYNLYTYKNQVDHYQQNHFQLHATHDFSSNLKLNISAHYTHGEGYYENYKTGEEYTDYNLTAPTPDATTDLINRKWLDNGFYGITTSLLYTLESTKFILGGAYNEYDGDHFGRVIWTQNGGTSSNDHEWYRGTGLKKDASGYLKVNHNINDLVFIFADIQYRHIDYSITGIDDDRRDIAQNHTFDFISPKIGITITPTDQITGYASFGQAHREPNRSNYIDAPSIAKRPTAERLNDFEAGASFSEKLFTVGANIYYMDYKNQLVSTGEVNDVGNPTMTNVDESYRAGIELSATIKPVSYLQWTINGTYSTNKIKNFTEEVDNWNFYYKDADDTETKQFITNNLKNTDIAFSPDLIINSDLHFQLMPSLGFSILSNFVSDQYIDNTSNHINPLFANKDMGEDAPNNNRKLDSYFINGIKIDYRVPQSLFKEVTFNFTVNNLLNESYESNAWVYSYTYNNTRYVMDGYYPQAGRNFMAKMSVKF